MWFDHVRAMYDPADACLMRGFQTPAHFYLQSSSDIRHAFLME
jgi:hypothetical protein